MTGGYAAADWKHRHGIRFGGSARWELMISGGDHWLVAATGHQVQRGGERVGAVV